MLKLALEEILLIVVIAHKVAIVIKIVCVGVRGLGTAFNKNVIKGVV